MNRTTFVNKIVALIEEWKIEGRSPDSVPRKTLEAMYDEVREQAVHDLAETIQQRDKAIERLHRHYIGK